MLVPYYACLSGFCPDFFTQRISRKSNNRAKNVERKKTDSQNEFLYVLLGMNLFQSYCTNMVYQIQKKKPGERVKGVGAGGALSAPLEKRLKEVLLVPIPSKSEFWFIGSPAKAKGGLVSLFKRNQLTDESLAEFRRGAATQPGTTLTHVQKLLKTYPDNSDLILVSAICQYGMQANSADNTMVLSGMMSSTKDAALSIMNDGISLYAVENFFHIYYNMMERLIRRQKDFYNEIKGDPRLDQQQKVLRQAIKQADSLYSDKKKVYNILEHLKKKLKSGAYLYNFSFEKIGKAAEYVVTGKETKMMDVCGAGDWFAYVYAMILAFARVPILSPLVDHLLSLMKSEDRSMVLRRLSITTVRNFILFRLAAMEGARERMKKIARVIYSENNDALKLLEGAPLYQVFESDPYFNVAYIVELTHGIFPYDEQVEMLKIAYAGMIKVVKMDMSKKQLFAESARTHIEKLEHLMEDSDAEDGGGMPASGRKGAKAEDAPEMSEPEEL